MTECFILDLQSKYQTVPAKIFYKFKMSDLNQSIHVITSRVEHRSFRNAGSDQKDNAPLEWFDIKKFTGNFFFNHDLVSYISVAITFFGKCHLRTFRCSHELFHNYGRKRTKTVTQTVHIYKRIDDFWNRFHFCQCHLPNFFRIRILDIRETDKHSGPLLSSSVSISIVRQAESSNWIANGASLSIHLTCVRIFARGSKNYALLPGLKL